MQQGNRDTICALSSGRERAGVAVVRLSGPNAMALGWSRFRSRRPRTVPPPREMILGVVLDNQGRELDDALLVYFPANSSYTGEPVVEFHLHGSPVIVEAVLESLMATGARAALPGEFTRRAFLAGRFDLTQAEAVADLIAARSLTAARAAHRRLTGALSGRIAALRDTLAEARALAEAAVDFPGEDIGHVEPTELLALIRRTREGVAELLAGHQRARTLAQGMVVALTGRPNAGKSSLLNLLAGARRALVHESPGTTRDLIEVEVEFAGAPVRLVDTAGLREAEHEVERQGVDLARRAIAEADLTIYLFDGAAGVTPEDRRLLAELDAADRLAVWNKTDLRPPDAAFAEFGDLAVSATRGDGLDALRERIAQMAGLDGGAGEALLATVRHAQAAAEAAQCLERAELLATNDLRWELVAEELRDAAAALGQIIGETTVDQVLEAIFSRFCVGK